MENQTNKTSLTNLFFVLFVGLKLTGNIDWSWWVITSPFWGGIILSIICQKIIKEVNSGNNRK